jgi:hypothetical protein
MVNTIDEHAPMKKRKSISQPAPFMNKTLRSAVYKKRMTDNGCQVMAKAHLAFGKVS